MKYLITILIIAFLSNCNRREADKTGYEGKSLPSFKLLLEDSSTYLDTKDIPTGKPVVLIYFGTQCPYSKAQIKNIIANIDKMKNIHFYLFTIESLKNMKSFNSKYHLNKYSNITTGIDYNNFFVSYYNAPGVPYTAIYGKDKVLKKVFIGNIESNQIQTEAYN